MSTARTLVLTLFALLALLAASVLWSAGPLADGLAISTGTVVPDVGAAPVDGTLFAISTGTIVPDVG